jgi:hypothetical protein
MRPLPGFLFVAALLAIGTPAVAEGRTARNLVLFCVQSVMPAQ